MKNPNGPIGNRTRTGHQSTAPPHFQILKERLDRINRFSVCSTAENFGSNFDAKMRDRKCIRKSHGLPTGRSVVREQDFNLVP